MFEIDAHELADAAAEFLGMADAIPREMAAELQVIQSQVEYAGVAEIKAVTPGSKGPDSLSGGTFPESVIEDLSLSTAIIQPKTIHSRRLGDIPLADIVRDGIKNPVTITPLDEENGVLAFLWKGGPSGDGMYFFKHVQQAKTPANPYPDRATPAIVSALDIIAERYGDAVVNSLLGAA